MTPTTARNDLSRSEAPAGQARPQTRPETPDHDARPGDAFLALARMPARALEDVLLRGQAPDLASLVGWEFRGLNTPPWARLLGIRKFIKGFYGPAGGAQPATTPAAIRGYNCAVVQNPVEEPWIGRPDPARPDRFGYFHVAAVDPTARDNAYLHAVLLDYGRDGNASLDPTRGLRDYLVQADPAQPDLFLGKAYYALGPARLGVSFFVLERYRRAHEICPATGQDPTPGTSLHASA
ncbi:MAG TPA: hypothetical protein VNM90_15755 [Haliangium sp.]|nr:hypothetical protein [Haliangium sp.]